MNTLLKLLAVPVVMLSLFIGHSTKAHDLITTSRTVEKKVELNSPKQFIKELRKFVRSINKERYQPEGYWEEVDNLWESFQVRKEVLQDQFTESQLEQVNALERKFRELRKRKSKLS